MVMVAHNLLAVMVSVGQITLLLMQEVLVKAQQHNLDAVVLAAVVDTTAVEAVMAELVQVVVVQVILQDLLIVK